MAFNAAFGPTSPTCVRTVACGGMICVVCVCIHDGVCVPVVCIIMYLGPGTCVRCNDPQMDIIGLEDMQCQR